jgi:type I restriction enzyme S subunit
MEGLKPYAAYRESGLTWLGQVPVHWEIKRGKSIFDRVDQRSITGKEELLTVSSERGIVPRRTASVTMFKAESYIGHKLCWPGDLVINSLWAWSRGLGVSRHHGIISSAYGVYRPRAAYKGYSAFFHEILRSSAFHWELQVRSKGVWISRLQLTDESFLDAPIPLPPPQDQAAIVRFLDHATHRLDKAIRAKRKIIALLNEQKQAIIHRAVTRGLDPDVPLKDSGIPWLGQIPAHWDVRRAKYLFREVDERSQTGDEELLSVSHITGVTPRSEKNITMFKAETYAGHKMCCPGDLVINTMWAWMAALGVSKHTGIISPAYAVYRPREPRKLTDEYSDFLLRTKPYVSNYICRSTGVRSSRMRLYPEEFFRIPIIIPPIAEQKALIDGLQNETRDIVATIQRVEREISLLREYRTRLIADVVTGKLDVREAAAHLPESAPEIADELDGAEADEALDDLAEEAA